MKTRTNFDPPSDPFGDEVECPVCGGNAEREGGKWFYWRCEDCNHTWGGNIEEADE